MIVSLHDASDPPAGSAGNRGLRPAANATMPSSHVADRSTGSAPRWEESVERLSDEMKRVQAAVGGVIRGKDAVVSKVLTAMLAGGSILLEDVPGVGKTTLAKCITTLMGLEFGRVQCTPDLLPADILGGPIFRPATGEFEFRPGPIFCNLLIADEVNRASPRTQSALLEAMAESQVTIDGSRYDLRRPFIVIATQNPDGFEGTFPLPESQLDRFLIRMEMDYPDAESEVALLVEPEMDAVDLPSVITAERFAHYQRCVSRVSVSRPIAEYLVSIVAATRIDPRIEVGVSPRGSKMWLSAARASAALQGRTYILPDDLQQTATGVLPHRMTARSSVATHGDLVAVIDDWVGRVPVPV